MGKDHVTALLDALLAIDAEGIAARAVAIASERIESVPGDYKMGLVVADDLRGGWTNRFDVEYSLRFPTNLKAGRGWLSGVLWSSEPATRESVLLAATMPIYRAGYIERHGLAQTLRDRLAQEGYVMTMAGLTESSLSLDDLDYFYCNRSPTLFTCWTCAAPGGQ